uniref:Uncharacterized protein n=1 Tax=Neogobius melanostomus TaxID=47308 RepID=A0A8C6T3P2_9GOBI
MATPKVTKPNLRETTIKAPAAKANLLKVGAATGESKSKVSSVRSVDRTASSLHPRTGPPISNSQRGTRATSTASKLTVQGSKTSPGYKKPTSCSPVKQATKCGQQRAHGQTQEHQLTTIKPSDTAFTVIPPDPKKRLEIQKKAEAELTALEELRLSKAMAYVSISPSAVGGCLSLEEVRQKQQQEMVQTKRKPREVTSNLTNC